MFLQAQLAAIKSQQQQQQNQQPQQQQNPAVATSKPLVSMPPQVIIYLQMVG